MTGQGTLSAIAAVLVLPLMISACASEGTARDDAIAADDPRRGEKVDKICFNRNIDGFSDTRKRSVVLETSPSKQYLVEVRGICSQLRSAQRIAIDSALSCVSRNDILIVSEQVFSGSSASRSPDRCFISAIYKWDRKALDREAEEGAAG